MNWPLFTNPVLLGGLAALAIPILIHLLLKTRRQRLRFSTLQFFRRPNEEARRRRRLRHWLLLLTRLSLLALLVLGFARPYLASRDAAQARQPRRQVLLVLDRSASMWAMDREGRRWDRAKAALRSILAGLRRDERAALISCGERAETLLGPSPPDEVLRLLDDLRPTQGRAELGEGLGLAGKLAAGTSGGFTNTIYLVSDLQRSGCRHLGSYPIPREAELKVVNFGDLFTPNIAVTQFSLAPRGPAKPYAVLANFSDEDTAAFKLQFLLDGREQISASVQLPGGGSTNLELRLPQLTPGWHSAEVRIQPKDALDLDDVRYQTINVPPPIEVLVVEPRRVPKLFLEESFFILSALDPTFGTTNQSNTAFELIKTTPETLAAKLDSPGDKVAGRVVILPALPQIPAGLAKNLETFVRAGGGIFMFLGDGVSANSYTTELGRLLPGQLGSVETAEALDWHLWETDPRSPVFAAFRVPNGGNLALAKFTRRFTLKGYAESAVIARFQDGVPLLLGTSLDRGRIILANTSADTGWTDWPKHRTFVPWVHGVVRFLGGNRTESGPRAATGFVAGTEAELNLGPARKRGAVSVQPPAGPLRAMTTDAEGTLRDLPLDEAGIYSVRTAEGQELERLAVNLPASESELVALAPADVERQVARLEATPEHSLADSLFGTAPEHRELWRLCLLAVLGLLVLEMLLANRTVAL